MGGRQIGSVQGRGREKSQGVHKRKQGGGGTSREGCQRAGRAQHRSLAPVGAGRAVLVGVVAPAEALLRQGGGWQRGSKHSRGNMKNAWGEGTQTEGWVRAGTQVCMYAWEIGSHQHRHGRGMLLRGQQERNAVTGARGGKGGELGWTVRWDLREQHLLRAWVAALAGGCFGWRLQPAPARRMPPTLCRWAGWRAAESRCLRRMAACGWATAAGLASAGHTVCCRRPPPALRRRGQASLTRAQ